MVIQWIIIALIVLIGLKYLKVENYLQNAKLFVLIIIIALIYFSMMGVFSSDKIDLNSPRGVANAIYVYYGWIGQTVGNIWGIGSNTANLIGNAIRINNSDKDESRRR